MKRHFVVTLIFIISLVGVSPSNAQVVNYALSLSAQNSMETLHPLCFEDGASYTVQLSVKCEQRQQGGVIFSVGDFTIEQSALEGNLKITTSPERSHMLSHQSLMSDWTQLSFVATETSLNIWVNGKLWDSYVGDYSWHGGSRVAQIGGGFSGEIDELRIFASAIEAQNLSHFNTLNHYHPNWDDMLLYYKFDQINCTERIIDYRGDNDGRASGGELQRVVNSDRKSRYMVVSGYSSFIRHNDRPNINQEMHLMTNDLIMLDAIVDGNSGRIYMQSAENGSLTSGALSLDSLDGRDGVLQLDGANYLSYCDNSHEDLKYLANALNVSAWLHLDELSEESTLYKKYVSRCDHVIITLARKDLRVSVEGRTVTFKDMPLKVAQWQHVAVNIAPNNLSFG
ncbi:MAG: LamG-like jellyroll fold domain-containing protein [Rikenellaceae bacterium]